MNNLNSVLIEGTLTKDPKMVIEDNGRTTAEFSISSERNYKKDEEYHKEVSLFGVCQDSCRINQIHQALFFKPVPAS